MGPFPDTRIERELYWRMKCRNQKAMRLAGSKCLSLEGDEFLSDLERDLRERATSRNAWP
jgi:hypothetical protein